MIISKTPFRMSFFGGGTDLPDFFRTHGGAVISTTFDKYCYVTVRHLPRFFEYENEIVYSRIERVGDPQQIEHPAVRNAMELLDMHELRVTYDADLPARTGIATSSSFAIGMLNAFHALKGQYASKRKLAEEAIRLERELCAEAGGWQDQVAASYGGFNKITFEGDRFEVFPLVIDPERKQRLNDNLLLFFTGFTRFSAEIQSEMDVSEKNRQLLAMLSMVDEAEHVLVDKKTPLRRFGELLDESWRVKRTLGSKVSTGPIDTIYDKALDAGAVGGKLLGAGGGGFLLFYVEPESRADVAEALKDLMEVPFAFENGGSRIIYYSPENYEKRG